MTNQKLVTDRISGHSYTVEMEAKNIVYLEDTDFPMKGWGNHVTDWYRIRVTPKRGVVEMGDYRDNWGGSGATEHGKIFLERKAILAFIEKAKAVLDEEDTDEAEYEAKQLVTDLDKMIVYERGY